jgi:hypothetical protein
VSSSKRVQDCGLSSKVARWPASMRMAPDLLAGGGGLTGGADYTHHQTRTGLVSSVTVALDNPSSTTVGRIFVRTEDGLVKIYTGGPTARLAWAGARARRLWTLKAKYTSTGEEGTREGARGTGASVCYLNFVSCPGLSNFLGPSLKIYEHNQARFL